MLERHECNKDACSRWISVQTIAHPNHDRPIIITDGNSSMPGYWGGNCFYSYQRTHDGVVWEPNITHWMDLPKLLV